MVEKVEQIYPERVIGQSIEKAYLEIVTKEVENYTAVD